MSVGHVARLLEEAGVATVVVAARAFENRLRAMSLPRVVLTPHLMGRPLGAPGDSARQRAALLAALQLLERATEPGTVVETPGAYRPMRPLLDDPGEKHSHTMQGRSTRSA